MRILAALLTLLPLLALASEQSFTCNVVGVTDGDTLSCFDPDRRKAEKIRLRGIDAPEAKQPFGQRSKQSLSHIAHGQPATVKWSKRDRWGRIIGAVAAATPSTSAVLSLPLAWPGGSSATPTSSQPRNGISMSLRSTRPKPAR